MPCKDLDLELLDFSKLPHLQEIEADKPAQTESGGAKVMAVEALIGF